MRHRPCSKLQDRQQSSVTASAEKATPINSRAQPGFKPKSLALLLAALLAASAWAADKPGNEVPLGEIVVGNTRENSTRRPFMYDQVAPFESCIVEELTKSGATNINEALDKLPCVAVQVECSICNARFISQNSLPGRYTTLLIDGVPLFSSVSQAYGLDSVGLRGLERIDLMRGEGAMVEMAIGEYGSYLPFVHLRREGYTRT